MWLQKLKTSCFPIPNNLHKENSKTLENLETKVHKTPLFLLNESILKQHRFTYLFSVYQLAEQLSMFECTKIVCQKSFLVTSSLKIWKVYCCLAEYKAMLTLS